MQTGSVRINDMRRLTFFILICISLAGCTTQWVPTTSSPTPFNEATMECNQLALRLFPVKNEVAQKSELRTVRQPCANGSQCGKDGYYTQSIPMTESYVMDVNQGSRNNTYNNCMQQKGWKQKIKYLL